MAKSAETAAMETLIFDLMDAYRASLTEGQLAAYIKAVAGFDVTSLAAGVARFSNGTVPWYTTDHRPPTAPELAREVELHYRKPVENARINIVAFPLGANPPEGYITYGGKVNFGAGNIDLSQLNESERDYVMSHNGRTEDGRSMAGMPVEDLREAIAQPALPIGRAVPKAKLQGMR